MADNPTNGVKDDFDITKPFRIQMSGTGDRKIALSYNPTSTTFLLETVNPNADETKPMVTQQIFMSVQEFNCIFPMFNRLFPHLDKTSYREITQLQVQQQEDQQTANAKVN